MNYLRKLFPIAFRQTSMPLVKRNETGKALISEEPYHLYRTGGYHSVRQGEIFNDIYKVIRKLGYGQYSTVWLARDLRTDHAVALKILTAESTEEKSSTFELEMLQYITRTPSMHIGKQYVLGLLDNFVHKGPHGEHLCLVHNVTGPNLSTFRRQLRQSRLPGYMVRKVTKQLLLALDYLHNSCKIIHTDIKPTNILIDIKDDSIFQQNLSSKHSSQDSFYVSSEPLSIDKSNPDLNILLADFGTASWVDKHLTELIQPVCLRAPEVILEAKWNESTDIWNAACVIFELMVGKVLFDGRPHANGDYASEHHLSQMVALFGQFPKELLSRGHVSEKYFDSEGNLKGIPQLTGFSLKNFIDNKEISEEEKSDFADFLAFMFELTPERRKTAHALLKEPWLNKEYQ